MPGVTHALSHLSTQQLADTCFLRQYAQHLLLLRGYRSKCSKLLILSSTNTNKLIYKKDKLLHLLHTLGHFFNHTPR